MMLHYIISGLFFWRRQSINPTVVGEELDNGEMVVGSVERGDNC